MSSLSRMPAFDRRSSPFRGPVRSIARRASETFHLFVDQLCFRGDRASHFVEFGSRAVRRKADARDAIDSFAIFRPRPDLQK